MNKFLTSLLAATILSAAAANAAEYPEKPIKIIVPYAPGGASDNLGRKVASILSKTFDQPVYIDNKPGAGGIIAGKTLASAPPDGYTIGVFDPTAITVTPHLYKKPPYDSLTAFQPITRLVDNAQIVVVAPTSKINSFQQLVSYAQAHPGTPYGTSAAVGITMLDFERLSAMAGFKMTNAPYRGSVPVLQDLIGGQLEFAVSDIASAMQFIKAGKVKPLAVASLQKLDSLPEVPALAKTGYPGFESVAWFGFFAPAGTPQHVIDRLNTALNTIGRSVEFRDWAAEQGFVVNVSERPADFGKKMRSEIESYGLTAKRLNVSLE